MPNSNNDMPPSWRPQYDNRLLGMRVHLPQGVFEVMAWDNRGVHLYRAGFTPVYKGWSGMQGLAIDHIVPLNEPTSFDEAIWLPAKAVKQLN